MKHKVFGRLFAAVAVSAMLTASFEATATAQAAMPMHQQPPFSGSGGGPGPTPAPDTRDWRGPDAPDRDRHCTRDGHWHNDDNDQAGHFDPQHCPTW
ncbi:hypothetical protein [Nocardia sp. NPDC051570]|uniref:hypothetical protein n=1 Tax=Nocardia sp. NPDC051570 TaxID=3364324 RepID=UPI0037B767DF